jgi:hypothetical protein
MAKLEILGASQSILPSTLVHHGPPASGDGDGYFRLVQILGTENLGSRVTSPFFRCILLYGEAAGSMGVQELYSLCILFMAVPVPRRRV